MNMMKKLTLVLHFYFRFRAVRRAIGKWHDEMRQVGMDGEDDGDCPLMWNGTYAVYRDAVRRSAKLLRPVCPVPLP